LTFVWSEFWRKMGHSTHAAAQITQLPAEKWQFVWAGDFYASYMNDCLELWGRGGLVRIGIAPYHIKDELDRVIDALKPIR